VHHKNEQKRDNSPDNLEGMGAADHIKHHSEERKKPPIKLECAWCGNSYTMPGNVFRHKVKQGQKRFFCSISHSVMYYLKFEPMSRGGRGRVTTHGALAMYRKGCRCDLCRAENAKKKREYMSAKRSGEQASLVTKP
jgi:hypothetical protein